MRFRLETTGQAGRRCDCRTQTGFSRSGCFRGNAKRERRRHPAVPPYVTNASGHRHMTFRVVVSSSPDPAACRVRRLPPTPSGVLHAAHRRTGRARVLSKVKGRHNGPDRHRPSPCLPKRRFVPQCFPNVLVPMRVPETGAVQNAARRGNHFAEGRARRRGKRVIDARLPAGRSQFNTLPSLFPTAKTVGFVKRSVITPR